MTTIEQDNNNKPMTTHINVRCDAQAMAAIKSYCERNNVSMTEVVINGALAFISDPVCVKVLALRKRADMLDEQADQLSGV